MSTSTKRQTPERPTVGRAKKAYPSDLEAWQGGELAHRVELGLKKLTDCVLCPRNCHVSRSHDEKKICRIGAPR